MTLYESWVSGAYDKNGRSIKKIWDIYMPLEQKVYEKMLETKQTHIYGTMEELSKRYNMPIQYVCGFLDGIKEALINKNGNIPIDVESLDETTFVDVTVSFEMLYKKMVEYKAEHLYTLPQWDGIFEPEKRKEMYIEQKKSGTLIRSADKIGRNNPCPCGSGKKYKKCCGMPVNTVTEDVPENKVADGVEINTATEE